MEMRQKLGQLMDQKTKPPGSLGRLEALAIQAGCIWNTTTPKVCKPHIVVFAGDHGIAETGLVNPYPQAVTAQMVRNFVTGGAAINVLCKENNIDLTVVDAGVNDNFEAGLPIIHAKIAMATANYITQPAMTSKQNRLAMLQGKEWVDNIAATGCNTIGFGEMGIGNSSSAALIMHHITGLPLADCVGKGTGANEVQYAKKIEILSQVAAFHTLGSKKMNSIQLMEHVGGFELAMMCGAYLSALENKMAIVVDGFIATAALLCAYNQNRNILSNCIFSHVSGEKGHKAMLDYLGVSALFNWSMRLGEGTGCAMAIPVLKSAVALLNDMATFDDAGVDKNH